MNLDSIYRLIEDTQVFPAPRGDACARGTCPSAPPAPQPREWDVAEELRRRELAEVRARAAQMEQTMRWWSDCTANWRDKWSKVRAERNSAREEGRRLRLQLDLALKELSSLKKKPAPGTPAGQAEGLIIDPLRVKEKMKLSFDYLHLFQNDSSVVKPALGLPAATEPPENEVLDISVLWVPLDEFRRILWKEREMRSSMGKELECLQSALSIWKQKYEELRESKLKNAKEELSELQHAYQKLSRQYQAKTTELTHANSRVDQSQAEVKKLRCQVEELKRELSKKDSELDVFRHQIRKLQRALDEQKEANDNLETELRHLQTR